jgi:hypothetical protein
LATAAAVPFAGAAFAAAGATDAEVLGLKKSASVFFAGDADAAGLAAAVAVAPVWVFLGARLAFGVPAGDTEGEAVVAV